MFIDDVIIGTESEEGHDELVVEVIKRLEKNDLYMKLEKMQVESEESRIFRGGYQRRWNKDERREGERCFGLADTKVCQGHTKVLRIGKLLLSIH